ncbi:MAG: peptidase [Gammaproteobacteria bacterium]|nr:peptidase [Gammaproteobacteria bacterium]
MTTPADAPTFSTTSLTLALTLGLALIFASPARAQESVQAVDPRIAAALKEISAARIQANIEKLVSFGTRSTLSAQDPVSIAAGQGIGAAREWIKSQFERYSKDCGGCLEVKTDAFIQEPAERVPQPTQLTNVYAVLKGTDPQAASRIVLVSGHYDSRVTDVLNFKDTAPGANDDGSGTAVSLECARVLSKLKFPATIVFLTVAAEEQGLLGSRHFAQVAKEQGWNIEAVLNNDIVGGNQGPGQDASVVRVFSEGIPVTADDKQLKQIRSIGGESDSPSRELARYIADVGAAYDPGVKALLIFRLDRYLRSGDHAAFNSQGFAAVRFTEYREDFNHQHQNLRTENGIEYGDLSKFVDFDYVTRVTRLNALTLASLASAPPAPLDVKVVTTNLDNDSTLKWRPSQGASGYEVIWRATSSPVWEHAQSLGNVTTTTLKLSKDNVIFAVRAVDAQGHRSLPVVPLPER